ncbi:MAG TPA: glycosyltransferase family 25 protein, partial [Dehalococcoidia bacterium]|nr:glycosyltransferase family 25 protein [Dehalococcoidia bacterium]
HFDPVWRAGMFGVWATDERGVDPTHEPFEIPMQGLGLFACRRDAWLGFSSRFRGFGGEEGYIHEKFRQAGRRTLCLPFLRWMHRFNRPFGTRYPINWEDRVRNYFIGHRETGVSTAALEEHFAEFLNPEVVQKVKEAVARESDNPFDFFDAIYCMNLDTEEDRWQLMRERFSKLGILHRVRRFGAVATPWNHHIGCALSHRAIVAQAQAQRLRNVLVFEDDAVFLDETLQHLGANLRELETIDWDVFHLGGHKWGNVYDKAAGCRHLERVSLMTCTQAVAYRDTIYDRLLDDLPDDPGTMAEWIEHNAAID